MSKVSLFLHKENDDNSNPIYEDFYANCTLFQKFVDTRSLVTPDEEEEIEKEFKTKYPDENFKEFLIKHNLNNTDICSGAQIYDTRSGKNYNSPKILSPFRQKNNPFNMQEFLREAIANNQIYYLNFEPDPYIDVDDEYETKNKQLAHQSLKDIGEIALVLKGQRKEIPYTLMDVQAENYIH